MESVASLPDTQQVIPVEKDRHGAIATMQILPVRFSRIEGSEPRWNGSQNLPQGRHPHTWVRHEQDSRPGRRPHHVQHRNSYLSAPNNP